VIAPIEKLRKENRVPHARAPSPPSRAVACRDEMRRDETRACAYVFPGGKGKG